MDIIIIIFSLIVLLLSVMIHEVAHGSVALYLGDPTAKHAGRLTLNPLKHLDPFGSIMLPLLLLVVTGGRGPIFGWTKPVPVNPYNFRDQKWGMLKVSVAGPATNFLIAIFFSLVIRFFPIPDSLLALLGIIAIYNFAWGIFNLVPIVPLDGSHILFTFLPQKWSRVKMVMGQYSLVFLFLFLFLGGVSLIFWGAQFLFLLFAS